mmetsp:Transcript_25181/g.37049  ORF Transcript_25181/g.37049 Transcript_25181/m.37049 type:complete len:497 (-) Transcript_25181:64-1554(-)|eukprot:CAMPEP_0195515040 /NCGR_PEP_ID=MMETSP0794_2-20130614/6251_1 /TAXON_ID=515487 /ORGANISM="Stephanopyxis turris, Strain CCMP 815" /LENGTH=496 /DNA_ID=CAMNT_0040643419 /DNA_START=39 /DNA_END=1529 /DNA_ORIENTATION=-
MMLVGRARASVIRRTITPTVARAFSGSAPEYDVCVIGGGPGGYVAAIKAGQLGLKTVCVEGRGSLGGTCLNVGCIPSKSLLHSSHLYEEATHKFADHGIIVDNVSVDFEKMMDAKSKSVDGLTKGIEGLFKKNKVDYVQGWGKIAGPNGVDVSLNDGGAQSIQAKNIIVATGSVVAELPPVPVDNEKQLIVDSTGALSLKKVPEKMVVIGGGVIGLELGSVYRRLGAEVHVVEFMPEICGGVVDKEINKAFHRTLKKQGMKFHLGKKVVASEVTGDQVKLTVEPAEGGDGEEMVADVVLVSTGRRPATDDIGLETVGISTTRGMIDTDATLRTSVPSIWAIGDAIDGPMLAHKAEEEGIAVVETIAGSHGHVNYDAIPSVIYTHPELAFVGKTEQELKEEGVSYNKGTFTMMANSRARTVLDTDGMVKILADKKTDRILGIHILGSNAGEMIAEGVLGMEYGASSEDIARTCHAHPTLSEGFKEAAMATYDKPIHS